MNSDRGAQGWLDQFAGYLEVERNYSSNTIRAYMNDLKQLITSDPTETKTEEEVIDFHPGENTAGFQEPIASPLPEEPKQSS